MSSWRRLSVDGKTYRWRGSHFVVVQDSNGQRVCSGPATEVKKITWDQWEHEMMRPGDVVRFIRRSMAA